MIASAARASRCAWTQDFPRHPPGVGVTLLAASRPTRSGARRRRGLRRDVGGRATPSSEAASVRARKRARTSTDLQKLRGELLELAVR